MQVQQVWVDPEVRGRGYGRRGMQDLCRFLLQRVPTVCLFVRAENEPGDPPLRDDRHAPRRLVPLDPVLVDGVTVPGGDAQRCRRAD